MMYENAGQRIREMTDTCTRNMPFRMATVTRISNGRPIIQFYGEVAESSKAYKYINSYVPSQGDKVILARISETYVIIGKVI